MTTREGEREGPRSADERVYLRRDEGDRVRALKGVQRIDPFHIPPELLATHPNLSFQWNNYEVLGKPDRRQAHSSSRRVGAHVRTACFRGITRLLASPATSSSRI